MERRYRRCVTSEKEGKEVVPFNREKVGGEEKKEGGPHDDVGYEFF